MLCPNCGAPVKPHPPRKPRIPLSWCSPAMKIGVKDKVYVPNEINPSDYPNDADYHEQKCDHPGIPHSFPSDTKEFDIPRNGERAPSRNKPAFAVRFFRLLLRRRKW